MIKTSRLNALFLALFIAVLGLQAQQLESDFLINQHNSVDLKATPFGQHTAEPLATNPEDSEKKRKKKAGKQQRKADEALKQVESVEKLIIELSIESDIRFFAKMRYNDSLSCYTLRSGFEPWIQRLNEMILEKPIDSLVHIFRGNSDYRLYSDDGNFMTLSITTYACQLRDMLENLENLKQAEEKNLLVIEIMSIQKNMSVEALPNSPEEAAKNLRKNIQRTLAAYGPELNYTFAQYEAFEKLKAPLDLKGLIDFRMRFLELMLNKLR